MNTRTLAALAAVATLALACGHHKDPDDVAGDTVAASESSAQSTGSVDDVLAAVSSTSDASTAATAFAGPSSKLWPPGCVTRTRDAAACDADKCVVHVAFDECTGPRGLVHLNGNEDVTITREGDGLHLDVQGISLTANGHPFSRTATADVTFGGDGSRVAQWQGHTSHVRPDGVVVDHTGTRTITHEAGTTCRTIHGSGVTMRGGREIDTSVDAKICRTAAGEEACPTGTETHVHKRSGKSVTLTFDGSATAELTRDGETTPVPLVCTPAP